MKRLKILIVGCAGIGLLATLSAMARDSIVVVQQQTASEILLEQPVDISLMAAKLIAPMAFAEVADIVVPASVPATPVFYLRTYYGMICRVPVKKFQAYHKRKYDPERSQYFRRVQYFNS